MCYDLGKLEEKLRKQGARAGHTPIEIDEAMSEYKRIWRGGKVLLTCFDHPDLPLVYQDGNEYKCDLMEWGLIKETPEMQNRTVNAMCETIFERKSYKEAILTHRALLPINGWFEHQHVGPKSYPYFIHDSEDEHFFMGCIYKIYPEFGYTFSIVTTAANPLVAKIHNKPANAQGPRMPLLFTGDSMLEWLNPSISKEEIKELMKTHPDDLMDAYTVKPIRKKEVDANSPSVLDEHRYAELDSKQMSLF